MGAYHAANLYFRHPEHADGFIALSGVYDLTLFIGDAMDDEIFYHVPLAYMPGLDDPKFLDRFRSGRLILCCGQGDWEEPMLTQTRQMSDILAHKRVPAWVDIWGADVSHEWPWWQKQMPYFLERIL
jgi:esterase/lipase superfamily enzyme